MLIRYIKVVLFALCISLYSAYSGVFGCSGPDSDDTATGSFPETCAEVQDVALDETGEILSNGTYTLYVDGDESMPWDAYCYDMSRAEPKEFIDVEELNNYSQISNGADIFETTYSRLRIDPVRLEIWPLDTTFADSNFEITDEDAPMLPEGMEHILLGWAEFQVIGFDESPVAAESNVSLAGTAFILDESVNDDGFFCDAGTDIPDEFKTTSATVADDLLSFTLSATTVYSDDGASVREVADCTNLGSDFDTMVEADVDAAVITLEYVGN